MTVKGQDRIRVCMVCPKAYPVFHPQVGATLGGAEVDIYYLATELAKDQAFEVTVIVADYGQEDVEMCEGVRLIKGLDLRSSAVRSGLGLWRALGLACADIYMIKTISIGVPMLACYCRIHKKAFVYRTSSGPSYDRQYLRANPLAGRAFLWAIRRADWVIAQTCQVAKVLRERYQVRSLAVVPNAHRLPPTGHDLPRQYILWVGRSDPIKRPELFVELARQMPGQRFVMICQQATGDTSYPDLVRWAGAVPNLQFVPGVPFDQIQTYFHKAKVLVNTSDSEGLPNTFIHACAAGVPIAALSVDPDGMLGERGCGVCAGGSLQRLVEQLNLLLEGDRYVHMGQIARAYALQNYDLSKVVDLYKQLFRRIVKR